jgi:hypothetical protein
MLKPVRQGGLKKVAHDKLQSKMYGVSMEKNAPQGQWAYYGKPAF